MTPVTVQPRYLIGAATVLTLGVLLRSATVDRVGAGPRPAGVERDAQL
jgi:hypothetical protein